MYYKKEFDEDNEDLFPFPQEYDNTNEYQDNDDKIYTTDTYGNESESGYQIMSEDENADHTVIDINNVNWTTPTISGRAVIPPVILKDYKSDKTILDSYKKVVTLTPAKEKFYSKMKELNELQLFSNNGIPCVEELDAAYEAGLVEYALGGIFSHTIK